MIHWTERSVDDFIYLITANFILQLEEKIRTEGLNKSELAQRLQMSEQSVSRIFNNPDKLTLKTIVRCVRALGLKVAIVAYDDEDPENKRGPINSEIFLKCWKKSNRPIDFWSLEK